MRLLFQRLLTPRSLAMLLWLVFAWYVFDGYDRHAPSNDEWVQHIYGELLVAYYTSGLADKTFLDFSNLYLYGGLFDLPAAWITMAFGIDWWPLRHLLTAAFGALAFLGAARFGRFLGGAWLGTAALAATMGSGVFSGASSPTPRTSLLPRPCCGRSTTRAASPTGFLRRVGATSCCGGSPPERRWGCA